MYKSIGKAGLVVTMALTANSTAEESIRFDKDVWPILVSRCLECHGELKQEGGLRLDSPSHIRANGQFGNIISPGSPLDSAIFELISLPSNDKEAMPGRGERLSPEQIDTFEKWILQGARFEGWNLEMQNAANRAVVLKNQSVIPDVNELPAEHLSFNRDIRAILSNNCASCHGPDAEARQAKLRLDSAEFATSDLGGRKAIIPGSLAESEMIRRLFHADPEQRMPPPGATRKPSDEERLTLASWIAQGAEYEQHWAYELPESHMLPDVENTEWPINNIDLFILANLEGRNLKPSPEAHRTTLIRRLHFDLIGLPPTPEEVDAYLRDNTPNAFERIVDRLLASPHFGERLAIYWLDLVRYADTAGYHGDQIRGASGYRDYVIDAFNSNMPFDRFTREQLAGDLIANATVEQRLASGYNRLNMVTREGGAQEGDYIVRYSADRVRTTASAWLGSSLGCAQCHDHKFDPFTAKDFYSFGAFFADIKEEGVQDKGGNEAPFPPFISIPTDNERAELEKIVGQIAALGPAEKGRRKSLQKNQSQIEGGMQSSVVTESREPRIIRVLARGNWQDESGEIVQPAIPAVLGRLDIGGERPTRLDLADWLTSSENPLTARVFANRLWKLYFGTGISKVLDDLGAQGEWPQHPELLDHLAVDFMNNGWDMKHAIKQMVMSATYRQSSMVNDELKEEDPYNRHVARQSRLRLDAELVRDNVLKISGLLVTEIGGRSVMPYQPPAYYRELNFPVRKYQQDSGGNLYRRGVYTHWQRTFLHPSLLAFDAPTREECTAERPVSNSPQQALILLNDPVFVEAARIFAERVFAEGGITKESRIEFAFREALSRTPTKEETDILIRLYNKHVVEFRLDPTSATDFLGVGAAMTSDSIDSIELAAWSSVCRTLFNLHETLYRY